MSQKRIAIIQGHPDPAGNHFGHALAKAYAEGAIAGGHEVRLIEIAKLDIPILRSHEQWLSSPLPPGLADAQEIIRWANHIVIIFPLWLGTMPALLKAFLEQLFRPGFGAVPRPSGRGFISQLNGRSARIVVTMGMPAIIYRWYFGAHGVRVIKRSILSFCGIRPIRTTLIGRVEVCSPERRTQWLTKMNTLGRSGR